MNLILERIYLQKKILYNDQWLVNCLERKFDWCINLVIDSEYINRPNQSSNQLFRNIFLRTNQHSASFLSSIFVWINLVYNFTTSHVISFPFLLISAKCHNDKSVSFVKAVDSGSLHLFYCGFHTEWLIWFLVPSKLLLITGLVILPSADSEIKRND